MTLRVQADDLDSTGLLRRAAPVIAHDLNNLRAVVQGNLRLARESVKAARWDELAEPLADVDLAFQQMAALTRGVLALTGDAPAVAPPAGALLPVLRRVEGLLRWALPPQFAIGVAIPEHDMQVVAEPELLTAALLRLALCARDTAPGGGKVEISADTPPPSGNCRQARVCVEIPAPAAGTGGDSPSRSKAALRYEFALALVRRAAEGCSGEVSCGTAEGRTAVCLLLPLSGGGAGG